MVDSIAMPKMKTSRLVQLIIDQIESGKLSAGDRLPAERDLANRYHCSRSTVRSSLEQLEKQAYIHRQQGRGTFVSDRSESKTNQLKTIGIILVAYKDNIANDPYINQVISALHKTSGKCTFNFIIFNHEERLETYLAAKGLSITSFDGYLALTYTFNGSEIDLLRKYDIPFAACAMKAGTKEISCVQIDNSGGAYIATSHLLSLGRKRLMLLNDKSNDEFAVAKREGFCKALCEHGLTYQDNMECGITPSEDTLAYQAVKKRLSENDGERPDALLVYGDWATFGAVTAIREAGLTVPEDIALVMYDDYPWVSKILGLPITSVRQPLEEQVSHLFALLLKKMEESQEKVNTIEILQPQLIVRRSCGVAL